MKRRALPAKIRRVSFDLSPARPMQGSLSMHPRPQETLFDMHFELELGVVLRGTMQRQYDDYRAALEPGETWFCGMWEPHGYAVLDAPCEVLVLVIQPQMLVELRFDEAPEVNWLAPFTLPPKQRPRVPPDARAEIAARARAFAEAFARQEPRRAVWLRLKLVELLLRLQEFARAPARREAPAPFYARINQAVQMVFESRNHVSSARASRACGLSRNRFDEVFRELMGLSFAKFALRYRLSGAAADLLRTPEPLKSIARAWGFTDASHLHRCFARHYGCTPDRYRRATREGQPAAPWRLSLAAPLAASQKDVKWDPPA
ncbi:MAG: AraC family transcriptional regulator [Planctomycetota bacterium]|nr:AraC family transcriptional regulator [Planctomycetota bacterium]